MSSAFTSVGTISSEAGALADKLPAGLVAHWDVHGTGYFGDGFLRVVDPIVTGQKLAGVADDVDLWIPVMTTGLVMAPRGMGSFIGMPVVGLLVGDATRVNVSVESRDGHTSGPLITTPSELLRGPHRIQTLVPYGVAVRAIDIMVETPNVSGVCVTSAQVDTVRAAP